MLSYVVKTCQYGQVLIGMKATKVCFISLGDDSQKIVEDFLQLHPEAVEAHADQSISQLINCVIKAIESPHKDHNLMLDMRGTEFQKMVWVALQKIPAGKKLSYADVAQLIGRPNSIRAVATACASNNIAILIPCHRVIRKSGELSGYRWGVDRKRKILEYESL